MGAASTVCSGKYLQRASFPRPATSTFIDNMLRDSPPASVAAAAAASSLAAFP